MRKNENLDPEELDDEEMEDENLEEDEDETEDESDEQEEEEDEEEPEESEEPEKPGKTPSQQPLFTRDDVSKIVSKRINAKNSRIKALEEDLGIIDEFCELTGLTKDQLKSRLTAMPLDQKAKLMGVTPEQVQAKTATSRQMKELQKTERRIKLQQEEMALKSDKKFSDIDSYRDDIDETLEKYPHMSLKEAYKFVKANLSDEDDLQRIIEQRIIEQKSSKANKRVVKGSGIVKSDKTPQLSADEKKVAEMMNMTEKEYLMYQKGSSLDDYSTKKKGKVR